MMKNVVLAILLTSIFMLNFNILGTNLSIKKINLGECYQGLSSGNHIINSFTELKAMQTKFYSNPSDTCHQAELPNIDFEKYTLLGYYKEASGCSLGYQPKVRKSIIRKKYIYKVKVNSSGNCAKLDFSSNWILVPKLPKGYTVKFN